MISTFGSTYFGSQYTVNLGTSVDLGEVAATSSTTVDLYNASDEYESSPIVLGLEDGSFQVSWPGQAALTNAAQLAATPLIVPPDARVQVTVTFLDPARTSVQSATLLWAGTSLTLDFLRYVTVENKPQGNVMETLQFKTNISEAWDGTEQRTRLRSNPRSTMALSYLLSAADRQTGREFQSQMMGFTSREAKVAMWHRTQPGVIQFTDGGSFLPNTFHVVLDGPTRWDPSISGLKVGDKVLLEDSAGNTFSVTLKLDATDSDRLSFGEAVSVGSSVKVVPQNLALLREGAEVEVYPSEATGFRSRWMSQQADYPGNSLDTSTLYTNLAPETFNGRPILREGNQIKRSLTFSGDSGAVRFDRRIGIIDTFQRRDTNTIEFDRIFDYTYEPGKIDALREFLMWTQGRQRSFYVPSGTQDFMALSRNAGASTLTLMGTGLGGLTPLLDGYASFEVTLLDGSRTQHTISSSVKNSDDSVTVTHEGALPSLAVNQGRFELLYHVRMASDSFQLKYESRESVVCKAMVQTVKQ
jgi:hypothetical protein